MCVNSLAALKRHKRSCKKTVSAETFLQELEGTTGVGGRKDILPIKNFSSEAAPTVEASMLMLKALQQALYAAMDYLRECDAVDSSPEPEVTCLSIGHSCRVLLLTAAAIKISKAVSGFPMISEVCFREMKFIAWTGYPCCDSQAGLHWRQEGWCLASDKRQPELGVVFGHTGWLDAGP